MGQVIQELARSVAALERGGGMAFGMMVSGDDIAPFAVDVIAALLEWRTRLEVVHGEDGRAMVDAIAARCEVLLDAAPPVPVAPSPAVERFIASLVPAQLEAAWRAGGQLDAGQVLRVQVGEPDPARLARVAELARAAFGFELPPSYLALVAIYNGVAVYPLDPPASLVRVAGEKLSEPVIWPAEAYGDHFQLDGVPVDGVERGFVFGELADAGLLVLDADGVGPVFWHPTRRIYGTEDVRLADAFEAFLVTFIECAVSVPLLLRRVGVPGWGA